MEWIWGIGILLLVGVAIGTGFNRLEVTGPQLENARVKCAINGGIDRIQTNALHESRVVCINGAAFELMRKP